MSNEYPERLYSFTALVKLFWWLAWRDYCAAYSKDKAVAFFQNKHGNNLIQVDYTSEADAAANGEYIDEEWNDREFWHPTR